MSNLDQSSVKRSSQSDAKLLINTNGTLSNNQKKVQNYDNGISAQTVQVKKISFGSRSVASTNVNKPSVVGTGVTSSFKSTVNASHISSSAQNVPKRNDRVDESFSKLNKVSPSEIYDKRDIGPSSRSINSTGNSMSVNKAIDDQRSNISKESISQVSFMGFSNKQIATSEFNDKKNPVASGALKTKQECNKSRGPKGSEVEERSSSGLYNSIIQNLPTLQTFDLSDNNDNGKGKNESKQNLMTITSNQSKKSFQETPSINDVPSFIKGTYKDDYNIIEVHNIIMRKFAHQKNNYVEQLKNKREMEMLKMKSSQTRVERINTNMRIENISKEIDKITNDTDVNKYLEEVSDIIESYKKLGTLPKVVSFRSKVEDTNNENSLDPSVKSQNEYRHKLISIYLEIASKYIQIDVIRDVDSDNHCRICGLSKDEYVLDEIGIIYCPKCNVESESVSRTSFYKDTTRVNTSSRNNYEDRDNFNKALLRYQGKQANKFPSDIMSKLDNYFISYGLPISEVIKGKPLDKSGRRGDTNKDMMYKALSDIGYASFYEDVNLLCHLYWGWLLPDITNIEDAIMDDYDKFQQIFQRIKIERKSCLNTQWMLWVLLRRRGHPCRIDDFKIVKTPDILEYHEDMTRRVFSELGWSFVPPKNKFP